MCRAGNFANPDPQECASCGACGPVASKGVAPALGDIESLFAWTATAAAKDQREPKDGSVKESSAAALVAQVVLSGTPAALSTLRTILAACKRGKESEVRDLVDAGVAEVLAMEFEGTLKQSSAHYVSWAIAKALVEGPDARAPQTLLDAGVLSRCSSVATKNRASVIDVLAALVREPERCAEVARQGGIRLLVKLVEPDADEPASAPEMRSRALALIRQAQLRAEVIAAADLRGPIEAVCMRIVREDDDQDARLAALEILHQLVQEQSTSEVSAIASGLLDLCVVVSRFEAGMRTGAEAVSVLQLLAENAKIAARLLKREAIAICHAHIAAATASPTSTTPWKLLVELTACPGAREMLAGAENVDEIVAAAVRVWRRALSCETPRRRPGPVGSTVEWWALIALQNLAAYEETQPAVLAGNACAACVEIVRCDDAAPAVVEHALGVFSNLSRNPACVDGLLASGSADAALALAVGMRTQPGICCAALRLLQNLSASPAGREALIVRNCPGECVNLALHKPDTARFHALATLSNLLAPRQSTGGFLPVDDAALLLSPHQIESCVALCKLGVLRPDKSTRGGQVMAMALLHRFSRMKRRPACMAALREHHIVGLCSRLIRRANRTPSTWFNAVVRGYSVEGYALLILYELAHEELHAEAMLQDRRLLQQLFRLASLAAEPRVSFANLTASLTLSCLAQPPAMSASRLDALLDLVKSALAGRCDAASFHLDWPVEDLLAAVDAALDDDHNRLHLLPRIAPVLVDFLNEAHCHPQEMLAVSTDALEAALRVVDQQHAAEVGFVEVPQLVRAALQEEVNRLPKDPLSCSLLLRISEEL